MTTPADQPDAPTDAREPGPLAVDHAEGPRGLTRTFDALGDRFFRLYFFGNLFQFGSMQMQMLVRGQLVYILTGSFAKLGLISLANAVPGLLFAPIAGVLADRMPKKTLMQFGQVYNFGNAAVLAALCATGAIRFEHLLISAALQGGVNTIMLTARQAMIPDLMGRDRLMNAVALSTSGQNFMQIFGPAAGATLMALVSPAAVFGTIAVAYLLSVTFTIQLPKEPLHSFNATEARAGRAPRRRNASFRELFLGMGYVAKDPTIRVLIVVNFFIVLAGFPYQQLLPGFVKEVLGGGAAMQGALQSMTGIGAIIGSLVIASSTPSRRGLKLIIIAIMLGIALILFAWSTNFLFTMFVILFVGAGNAGRMSLGQVLLQSYTDDEYRGRVLSVWQMQISVVSLGTFAMGVLAEWVGPQLAIGGLAAAMLVIMAGTLVFVPRIRDLD